MANWMTVAVVGAIVVGFGLLFASAESPKFKEGFGGFLKGLAMLLFFPSLLVGMIWGGISGVQWLARHPLF